MKFNFGLLAILGLELVGSIVSQDLPICNPRLAKRRKNISQMENWEVQRYFNAIKKLNSGPRPTTWDSFAKTHIDNYDMVHQTDYFLIWHRVFLFTVERELQKIDPAVTIPYWDWTVHGQKPELDPVFSNKLFGGQGDRNTGCIKDGQFKDFRVYYWHSGEGSNHCLIRRRDIFSTTFVIPQLIDRTYLENVPAKNFANQIENAPHGSAHNNIGGEFSGHASNSDPLFYAHHSFIDKLYSDWQNRHPEHAFNYPLPLREVLKPFNVKVVQALDPLDRFCYYYKEEHFKWSGPNWSNPTQRMARSAFVFPASAPVANLTNSEPVPELDPYFLTKNVTTLEGLKKHDEDYIKKGIDAPPSDDKSDLLKLRVREPMNPEMITMMKMDFTLTRELERRDAIFTHNLNKNESFVSEAAIGVIENKLPLVAVK